VVIAAGGTGGHMFPAQALSEAMLAEGWRVRLATDTRGARYAGNFPINVERQVLTAATFARGGLIAKLAVPLRIGMGIVSALASMLRDRPDAVIGFGGYPALPTMAAAWVLRVPRMIHEQNGVLGRVNAVFAKRVNKVACAVWPTELPAGVAAVHTGNPVRASIRQAAAAPYSELGAGPINLLVFGGSQGATVLSQKIPPAIAALPQDLRRRLFVAHQAREADHQQVVDAYAAIGVTADVTPFFEDMAQRLVAAHLVISRAGASSVADIAAIGRPSILVPLAIAIRDEQTANARGLVDAGAALLFQEPDLAAAALSEAITDILTTPGRAAEMASAAMALGRPDAAERLMTEVKELAGLT